MKINNFLLVLFVATLICSSVQAQKITDEELRKYTVAMDSIETLKEQLSATIINLSKGNNRISSNRFNTLMPIINDEAKLTEAKATPEEIEYLKKAMAIRKDETIKFQQTYQSLINDYVGEAVFSKVRNSLKTDTVLRKKYDSLLSKFRQ